MGITKFAFLTDIHFGFERRNGHKVALHDPTAFAVTLSYLRDFRPDVLILGGDILDCGAISHHNHGKPGRTEGLRLLQDARDCRRMVLDPLEALRPVRQIYITGNHEDWLTDLTDDQPGLEGIIGLRPLLKLGPKWEVIEQGGYLNLGKLTFIHGDTLGPGEHHAKNAVISYERSIRFGHFHTFQAYTKTSPIDVKLGRTGIAVPCLCTKGPKYGESKPNRWVQGFCSGYVTSDGTYSDYISIITNGRLVAPNGKVYCA